MNTKDEDEVKFFSELNALSPQQSCVSGVLYTILTGEARRSWKVDRDNSKHLLKLLKEIGNIDLDFSILKASLALANLDPESKIQLKAIVSSVIQRRKETLLPSDDLYAFVLKSVHSSLIAPENQ